MASVTQTDRPTPPGAVLDLLDQLRSRIRWYVVIEGVAMLIVCLAIAFWIGYAFDYLPVLLGANEMPREARAVLLGLTALALCWVLYHYILRRVFHAFRNSSLALLIEKHFPAFRDSLVTTVELEEGTNSHFDEADRQAIMEATGQDPSALGAEMLTQTVDRAQRAVSSVRLSKVFSYWPLMSKLFAAVVAVASIVLLAVFSRDAFGTATSRLLLLSNEAWERRARIELVGFDENGIRKVAKGTDLIMRVRADANREFPPPELCSILYQTSDGDRGRVNMSRDGEPNEGYQNYVFNGKPFKSILNDIRFDVIGGDYRLRDNRVQVVLSPVVSSVQLKTQFPAYTELLPRDEKWTPGTQLPIGSQISATVRSSKSLVSAKIKDIDTGEEQLLEFPTGETHLQFTHNIEKLAGRVALAITLYDTDGIESLEPFLLTIGAIEDEIPKVDMALRGIGNAITANAKLKVEGKISDDYDVVRNWFDLRIGDTSREFEFPTQWGEETELGLDLREQSATEQENPLQLQPQDRVIFTVRAADKFDLDGQSHVGSNEPTSLTVVRPDELLAILDGRELGLRRRFEQIRSEVLQSRDSLTRLRASFIEEGDEGSSAEDSTGDDEQDAAKALQNLADLRDRWASWAEQKSDQSMLEVEGIALAFEDIHEELTNNRVDTPERKSRLQDQIIAPLRTIAEQAFPKFQSSLKRLRSDLSAADGSVAEQQSIVVLENADNIIVAMDAVLDKMLELEDYAEIINIVRQIMEQQEKLLEQTKEEQKAKVLDFLN